jgi:hypothetical protein
MRVPRGETVFPPCLPQTREFACPLFQRVIICAVLAKLSGCSAPSSLAEYSRSRFTAGAQIITGEKLIANSAQTAARSIR